MGLSKIPKCLFPFIITSLITSNKKFVSILVIHLMVEYHNKFHLLFQELRVHLKMFMDCDIRWNTFNLWQSWFRVFKHIFLRGNSLTLGSGKLGFLEVFLSFDVNVFNCFLVYYFQGNSSLAIVLFVSLLSLLELLLFFHDTKFFTSFFYLFHCHLFLSSSFENFKHGLPQLECPKFIEVNNVMQCPKVTKANNVTQCSKIAESNNVTMSVFHTFPFSSIFLLSILQNIIPNPKHFMLT